MRTSLPLLAVVLAASFFLTACGQMYDELPTAEPSPSRTLTFTSTSTATSTFPPSATPTATPIPCDPSSADYCIVDGTFLLQRPIAAPGTDSVERTYAYGSTAGGTRDPHHGVEFNNGPGTPVLAAADGTVVYAGDDTTTLFSRWSNFYGNLVVLEHALPSQTIYTLYAHLSKIVVTTGQSVTAGEKIAEVGASGGAIGSHLHFEVRLDPQEYASCLNPELWLDTFPGTGVLSLRFVDETGQFIQAQPDVQYYPDPTAPYTMAWQPEVYARELLNGSNWENAVLGNLPAGSYRISFYWAYRLNEAWVQIQSGKLTQVEFVVK